MTIINRTLFAANVFIISILFLIFFFLEAITESKEKETKENLENKIITLFPDVSGSYLEKYLQKTRKLIEETSNESTKISHLSRQDNDFYSDFSYSTRQDDYSYLDFDLINKIQQNLKSESAQLDKLHQYIRTQNLDGQKDYLLFLISKKLELENHEKLEELGSVQSSISGLRKKLEFSYLANNSLNNMQDAFRYLDAYWQIHSLGQDPSGELFNGIHYTDSQLDAYRQIRYPPSDWENHFEASNENLEASFEISIFEDLLSTRSRFSTTLFLYGQISYSNPTLIDRFLNGFAFEKYFRLLNSNAAYVKSNTYKSHKFQELLMSENICIISQSDLEAYLVAPNYWTNQLSLSRVIVDDIYKIYLSRINMELTKKVLNMKAQIRELGEIPAVSKEMEKSEVCPNIKWQYTTSEPGILHIDMVERPLWLEEYLKENLITTTRSSGEIRSASSARLIDSPIGYGINLNWVLSQR